MTFREKVTETVILVAGLLVFCGLFAGIIMGVIHEKEKREADYQASRTPAVIKSVLYPDASNWCVVETIDGRLFRGRCHRQGIPLGKPVIIGFMDHELAGMTMIIEDAPDKGIK